MNEPTIMELYRQVCLVVKSSGAILTKRYYSTRSLAANVIINTKIMYIFIGEKKLLDLNEV